MQRETSNDSFLDYGSVYHQPIAMSPSSTASTAIPIYR